MTVELKGREMERKAGCLARREESGRDCCRLRARSKEAQYSFNAI